jgi:hypothetical protein
MAVVIFYLKKEKRQPEMIVADHLKSIGRNSAR